MYRRSAGITIVELLTVIVVVGILATIATIGFGAYQANTRDVQRAASATAVAESLEKYFEDHGEYPGCSKIGADGLSVVTDTLKGLDQQALLVPNADPAVSNYLQCGDSELSVEGDDYFEYVGDDTSTCQEGPACLTYTLRYKNESDGTINSISARHDVSLGSSGTTHVSLNNVTFTEVSLVWTDVPSTLHYIVERATNTSFTSGRTSTTTENTSFTATGLAQGTTYYFRVRAVSPLGNSAWSNIRSATTLSLNAPSISIPAESVTASSFDVSWGSVTHATSYTLQYSTASNFSSPTVVSDLEETSHEVTGLQTGTRYYVRVQAVAGSTTGSWSNVVNRTTTVPVPTSVTATTNSSTQITVSWNSVSVADTYRIQYSTSSNFSSASTINGITDTSRAVTGLNQGQTYYFRVFALVGSVPSAASDTASSATTINAPSTPSVTTYNWPVSAGKIRTCAAGYWIRYPSACPNNYYAEGIGSGASCPSGTTRQFRARAQYTHGGQAWHGWTSWNTATTWYMTRSTDNIKFQFQARCVNGSIVSSTSGTGQQCRNVYNNVISCW